MIGWRKGASWVLLLTYVTVSTSIIHVTPADFHSSIHLDSCFPFHTSGHFYLVWIRLVLWSNPCATDFNILLSTSCSICIILVVGQKTLGMYKQISSQCSAKKGSDHLNSMKAFNHSPYSLVLLEKKIRLLYSQRTDRQLYYHKSQEIKEILLGMLSSTAFR
jgi:hypothetical protein